MKEKQEENEVLTCDIRVSLAWDADDVDVDLHVVEPDGEEIYYGHKGSSQGAKLSRDFTQGYGPEEYVLPYALKKGKYLVKATYFAAHGQHMQSRLLDLAGSTTLTCTVFRSYGRLDERVVVHTHRLEEVKQKHDVFSFVVE